ncbi:uncharacterized protein GGS22DRAFT_154345 [Annulohypoxylon maeteangense]|uniref:uncharacterized protein n=1 Tax=Annulohypoxylon maeteangense TaxID=1927788 RepID=UPI00200723AD|nr:uncharacterized protein GGS22DRAFT_154345 [Annulohypoxylon maeteangense]KAI0887806.1 hypothetical protein GGS22DRAFT_154345 [Annulohypoxylon maeteangense]
MAPPTLQASSSVLSTSSTSEKAVEQAEQKEIEATWKEVQNKVIELAGGDPKKVQTLDINSVLKYIDSVQASDKKKSEKFGAFKSVVNKTLQCINTVGGIVAEGASTVFAPAGMCYNALTFVIQAWQGYEGIFENLAELLEKCTEFFERLESYEGRMDVRLKRVAVQNLRLFVEICDRTIKLRRKHNKFLAFTKQLFLNDNGISDLLGMMDRLNAKESLLVNAQTYKLVSDSAGDIKLILDGQKEQKKEQEAKKWRTTIAKALGFPPNTLDNDGEPIPNWQRAFNARKNTLVPETGKWIMDHEDFVEWSKSTVPSKPVLVLGGRNGSGKTSMMANTLRFLRSMNRAGPTSRAVTAYFFLEGEKKKSDDEEASSSRLEVVSRTLLWQICTAYEAMTKSVYQILERTPDFDGSIDLWQQIFINNKERLNPDTTFFLFIDGISNELLPLLQRLTSIVDNKIVRIFLTAPPKMFTELDGTEGIRTNTIPIADYNADDIDKYINFRMDNMPILKNDGRAGISEWRNKILETLRYKCAGDYFKLNTSLNSLAKVDLIDDIEEVLADADKTRADQIDAEIRRLNNIRTVKEIQEINEIIQWIEAGRRWLPVDMMESFLSVKHRNSAVAQPLTPSLTRRKTGLSDIESTTQEATPMILTISLLPFAQKLGEKYPIFTVTDSGFVDWRSSEIKERVPMKGFERDSRDSGSGLSVVTSGPKIIQESEISIVRHFLNNVCPPDLYQRLEFEQFFDMKLGAKYKDYISLDLDNANIKIALTCLIVLTEEQLRKNTSVRQYAMYWLLDHLQDVDLSAADRELKAQIGPLLVKLFTEECGIDSMFWPFNLNVSLHTWDWDEYIDLRETRAEWLYSMSGVQEISRWLRDSSVTKYITHEPGLSFVEAAKSSSTNLHKVILSHAAKHMATHLFRRVEFTPRHFWCACWFIRGYLSRLNPEKSSQMPSDPDAYRNINDPAYEEFENREFTLETLKQIEDWAADELEKTNDTPEQQSSWEIHGALIIFQLCHTEADATKIYQARAQKAVDLNPKNWHACHFLTKQPNTGNEEAVRLLSQAKKDIDEVRGRNEFWIRDSANSALLARITLDLGDRLWDLGQDMALAAATHRESLRYNYVHFKDYSKVLTRYQARGAWDELIAFVETLNSTSETWAAYFDELVYEFVVQITNSEDANVLAQAADATKRWDVIEAFFTLAIDMGVAQDTHDLLFFLRDGFAKTLEAAADGAQQDKVIAIQEMALGDVRLHRNDSLSRHSVDDMTNALARTYLDKAFQPGLAIERVDSYGSLIANLLPDPDSTDGCDLWTGTIAVCCLIRYHHRRKTDSHLARGWIERIVREIIELLSDDDEENDESAYWLLARLLTTIEDTKNTRIVWAMRNAEQREALIKWESWVAKNAGTITDVTANGGPKDKEPQQQTTPVIPHSNGFANKSVQNVVRNGHRSRSQSPKPGGKGEHKSQPSEVIREPTPELKAPEPACISDDPNQPGWFVSCDGCYKQWTVIDEPVYTCADCLGATQLDAECYALLLKGELKKKGINCKKEHTFIELPNWDEKEYEGMPKGSVPLPDGEKGKKWMTLEEWKKELRGLYLNGDGKGVTA